MSDLTGVASRSVSPRDRLQIDDLTAALARRDHPAQFAERLVDRAKLDAQGLDLGGKLALRGGALLLQRVSSLTRDDQRRVSTEILLRAAPARASASAVILDLDL